MAEDWLYDKAVKIFKKEYGELELFFPSYKKYFYLNKLAKAYGKDKIQIDIIAFNETNKILVLGEAKEFLSFEAISLCMEQLYLKLYILEKFHNNDFNSKKLLGFLKEFKVYRYIILGSYTSKSYQNAKANTIDELERRKEEYLKYLSFRNANGFGLLMFLNEDKDEYVLKHAEPLKNIIG